MCGGRVVVGFLFEKDICVCARMGLFLKILGWKAFFVILGCVGEGFGVFLFFDNLPHDYLIKVGAVISILSEY